MISGAAARSGIEAQLIESIITLLHDPSPIGAPIQERGLVQLAISQLLTWGCMRSGPDLAWRLLKRNTIAAHTEACQDVWFNIWTGPDAINSKAALNPSGTWSAQ